MLVECKKVKQRSGEPIRRWFSDNLFDLIIWENEFNEIVRFHLCYGKHSHEKAVTWSVSEGFKHLSVDDGESVDGKYKMSPLLVLNGPINFNVLKSSFKAVSSSISNDISDFIINKLKELENDY